MSQQHTTRASGRGCGTRVQTARTWHDGTDRSDRRFNHLPDDGVYRFVNPQILGVAGMDTSAVFVTTCLIAAFGSILMGLFANLPVALAPAMGLNAFFAFVVVGAMGLSAADRYGCYLLGRGRSAAADHFPRTLLDDCQYPS